MSVSSPLSSDASLDLDSMASPPVPISSRPQKQLKPQAYLKDYQCAMLHSAHTTAHPLHHYLHYVYVDNVVTAGRNFELVAQFKLDLAAYLKIKDL
ncbi:hypothetical protein Dimus_022083, partial [Dionaea muscipula]